MSTGQASARPWAGPSYSRARCGPPVPWQGSFPAQALSGWADSKTPPDLWGQPSPAPHARPQDKFSGPQTTPSHPPQIPPPPLCWWQHPCTAWALALPGLGVGEGPDGASCPKQETPSPSPGPCALPRSPHSPDTDSGHPLAHPVGLGSSGVSGGCPRLTGRRVQSSHLGLRIPSTAPTPLRGGEGAD